MFGHSYSKTFKSTFSFPEFVSTFTRLGQHQHYAKSATFSQVFWENLFPKNLPLSCTTSYGFLTPCENLEKTKSNLQKMFRQKDRRKDRLYFEGLLQLQKGVKRVEKLLETFLVSLGYQTCQDYSTNFQKELQVISKLGKLIPFKFMQFGIITSTFYPTLFSVFNILDYEEQDRNKIGGT